MNKFVLACYDLAKTYIDGSSKIEILKQVNLEVTPGEMVAIVGISGSGKSTLLHLLAGLDKPSKGYVVLNGKKFNSLSERQKCFLRNNYLGFVYQFHHILPEFSALENVGLPLLIHGEPPANVKEKASYLLSQVGLQDRLHHRLGQLSGGERQRVAIARALINDPLCILADEPTGNLDPHNAERVLELFFSLQQQFHMSVVMVTHDLDIARRAQRIMKIEEGKLVSA